MAAGDEKHPRALFKRHIAITHFASEKKYCIQEEADREKIEGERERDKERGFAKSQEGLLKDREGERK